jgi:hypothetical protein
LIHVNAADRRTSYLGQNSRTRSGQPSPLVMHDYADGRATVEAGGEQVWAESGVCSGNRHNIGCSFARLFRHLADVVMLQILGCVQIAIESEYMIR